jgi:hypothetical protein
VRYSRVFAGFAEHSRHTTHTGKVFHKNCFKCSVCKCVLKVIDYAHLDGIFYWYRLYFVR